LYHQEIHNFLLTLFLTVVNEDETHLMDALNYLGIWGNHKGLGQSRCGDPRAKEYMLRCPFCTSEFKAWLLEGEVIVDCPSYSCGKTFVIEELLRPDYRAKNGKISDK